MNTAEDRRKKLKELLDYCTSVMEAMVFSARGDDVWRHSSYYEYAQKNNEIVEYLKPVINHNIPIGHYDKNPFLIQFTLISQSLKHI